jgi:hypothetical protein
MLFSQTDPILESSSDISYYCANFVYPELKAHMSSCNISIWNNTWSDQFDFTPNKIGGSNFKFIDDDADGFIDSFKTITQNVMIIQAQQQDPTLDLSQIDLNFNEEQVPLIPITTGNIPKPAKCHAFVLFLASDGETVYQIYEYLYFAYFKGKRDQYWLKGNFIFLTILETREVNLTETELAEVLNIDMSDKAYNDKFITIAKNHKLIGLHICAAEDVDFSNQIATYLTKRHVALEFYLSFNKDAVQQQSIKFFKEYNKEDKGQKID